MWDLWWTKWRWGRFSPSTSVSPANLHSTNFSTITIAHHLGLVQQASSGRSTMRLSRPTNNNSIQFTFIYVQTEQPEGQLQSNNNNNNNNNIKIITFLFDFS
jgi:hypothetical protein